ncbi:MAG TPA: hypothetical protein PKE07_13895 [Lacibacter sp.]|nr:hypothetical protein [Lacibacter sp.]HMO88627.1 hypothetical protein [Lacibacter sp.]
MYDLFLAKINSKFVTKPVKIFFSAIPAEQPTICHILLIYNNHFVEVVTTTQSKMVNLLIDYQLLIVYSSRCNHPGSRNTVHPDFYSHRAKIILKSGGNL